MKKSTMLATAAFAVLLGLFVPCTSHATEIKDTDPTTVQWDKATRKECTNSEGVSYVDYTFPEDKTQSYNSYDDAVTSLTKFTVDAVADHKSNYIILRVPVKIKTAQSVDEYQLQSDVEDKINSWIRFGGNMTKREILSFSGSDWKKHENLSSFYTYLDDYAYTGGELTGTFKIAVNYKTRYDFTEYETKCLNAIKEMNVDGKSDYDKALALCKWVNKHIKYKSSEVFLGDQSGMQGMMEGWGVCNAYATLTCYLGRCLGLDVLYEGGDTWLDSHAWNLVKIGDEWYYMDPTKSGHEEDSIFSGYFLQGNDWLKCNVKELDDQFKDYNKIYNISDISYANKHNTCEHDWGTSALFNVTMNLKDSTCDIPYNVSYKCTKCNAYKWEYYKDPKGHTPGKVIRVDREANCYTEGLQVRECTVCGKGYWETIPMTQHHWVDGKCTICGDECTHTYGEKTIVTPATCTTYGSYTKTCTTCGYVYKGQIPKTQHNYEWKVTTPATCNSTGVETKTCTNCGKTYGQRTIPATGEHNWETVETIPATCTSKEKQKQECTVCRTTRTTINENSHYADHTWTEGNGTVTCTKCGWEHTHRWVEDTSKTVPATCTSEGSKTYYCTADYKDYDQEIHKCHSTKTETLAKTAHHWVNGVCTECGATHEHDWQEQTSLAKSPTCTEKGSKTYKCSKCGETKVEEIPATGHTWKIHQIAQNKSECKCSVCGATKAHDLKVVSKDPATCTKKGIIHYVCKDCGKKVRDNDPDAPALGHDWKNQDGTCSRCNEQHTHDWGEWKTTTPADCTTEGEEVRQCKVCQKTESRTLAKTAHQWSTWKTTTNPSYASEGEQTRQCSQCHQTETRKLNKLPLPKAGTKYTVGGNQYTVLKAGLSVRFSKANPKAKTVTIPNTITVNGISYKVAEVGANAFKNNKKVKKVTIGANVVKIANKAFNKCPILRNVIIKTTLLTKKTASKKCFNKVHKKMVIKVPKKVKKSYVKIFKGFKVK